jgi:hypothetical protein
LHAAAIPPFPLISLTSCHIAGEKQMDPNENSSSIMSPLALDIVLDGSARIWAKMHAFDTDRVMRWTELPEFRGLVEKHRLEHCERVLGKAASHADKAIDRLAEFSEHTDLPGASLFASKVILQQWVKLSEFFVQEAQLQSISARLKAFSERQKAAGWNY